MKTLLLFLILFVNSFSKDTLQVAVYNSAPFGMIDYSGRISGLSVDCWEDVAKRLGYNYQYTLTDMDDLIEGLQIGKYDVAIGAITITPIREELVDFTHPINPSGTGMAVSKKSFKSPFWSLWELVLINLLELLSGLFLLLIFFGTLIWIFERKNNKEEFSNDIKGLGDGIWWAAVTMTTVGYGDKSPKTTLGKLFAIVWMFTSIILVSLFTASTSSILTTSKMESEIQTKNDLREVNVGAARYSSGEEYLLRHKIEYTAYNDVETAIDDMLKENIDCVVSNVPVIRYLALTKYKKEMKVVNRLLAENYMGFAIKVNSSLKEELNREILKKTSEESWRETVVSYLGEM